MQSEYFLKLLLEQLDRLGVPEHGRGVRLVTASGYSSGHVSDILNGKKNCTEKFYKLAMIGLSQSEESNVHPANLVPVYGSVPAGWPDEKEGIVQEEIIDWIPVGGSTHGIGALRVGGHSMSPEIRDGMYVLYVKDYDIKPGDVIVVTDEFRRAMVKQYVLKNGEPWLVSINTEYPSFRINENYHVVGRVFEKYDKSRVGRGR